MAPMRRCSPIPRSRRSTIPLPNHLHVPLTLAAAKAGKHVLCEKPIAITAKEAKKLKNVRKGIYVAEAFMVRHALQWQAVRERVAKGEIGTPRLIQVLFTYYLDDPKNVRNIAKIGGGGLLDIGCYPITVARYIFDAEPKRGDGGVRPRSRLQDRPHGERACRFRQGPAPVLRHLDPGRSLPARPDRRHQGAHRGRNPLQRAARQAEPLFRAGHGR